MSRVRGVVGAEPPGPPGFPDVETLTRLANELFGEYNSTGARSPTTPQVAPTAAIPHTIDPAAEPSAPTPSTTAASSVSAPTRPLLPLEPTTLVPGVGRSGATSFGTNQFAIPSVGGPSIGGSTLPMSSTPDFYFLDDALRAGPAWQDAPSETPGRDGSGFDALAVRRDFPILQERVNGRQLVWLDNAATTQKPQVVIDRLAYFYEHENSNIHRAAHELAARASDAYEGARASVARFIGAPSSDNIVFVRGTTEAINLVAKSWGVANIGEGDEIVISHLEHHANIVPWQQLTEQTGAKLRVIPVDDDGQIRLDEYARLLNERTRLVSVTYVSNALGTIVPVHEVVQLAHAAGARVLIDGAQSVPHIRADVVALDADFFVFSGHKVFGPTGIGALYGKQDVLESMPPWEGGGNMIKDVTFEHTTYHSPRPVSRPEPATSPMPLGLGAALDYLQGIGIERVAQYEHALLDYATQAMSSVQGLRLIGTAPQKASVLSFVLDGWEPLEVGTALNREGIAVRAGHHCAQPILRRFGVEATVRPSLVPDRCRRISCELRTRRVRGDAAPRPIRLRRAADVGRESLLAASATPGQVATVDQRRSTGLRSTARHARRGRRASPRRSGGSGTRFALTTWTSE